MGLRFALRRLHIDPDKDTKIITAGGNPERFAALAKGVINFTIMPEPFVRQALQLGFRHLFDIGSLNIPFWWGGVLSREAIVKSLRALRHLGWIENQGRDIRVHDLPSLQQRGSLTL